MVRAGLCMGAVACDPQCDVQRHAGHTTRAMQRALSRACGLQLTNFTLTQTPVPLSFPFLRRHCHRGPVFAAPSISVD